MEKIVSGENRFMIYVSEQFEKILLNILKNEVLRDVHKHFSKYLETCTNINWVNWIQTITILQVL